MEIVLQIVLVITSLLMILLVLLHKGKGGGLSDLFGGGVSSSLGGSSVVERNLDRLTIGIGHHLDRLDRGARPAAQDADPARPESTTYTDARRGRPGRRERHLENWGAHRGKWQRDPRQPGRRRTDGRGRARRVCARGSGCPTGAPTATRPSPASPRTPRSRRPRPGTARGAASRPARTRTNPPSPPRTEPYKTHLAYVKERRSDADGAAILEEALAKLRGN